MIVTIETDAGLTGIGEGGVKDTLEQCASSIIGENPFQIEKLWQKMYSDRFYPPGREKIHAQGAIDLALWDIKGKALGLPVHEVLGGTVRNYCECYQTSGPRPTDKTISLKDRAAKAMADGFRCYRVDASITPTGGAPIVNDVYNTHQRVHEVVAAAQGNPRGRRPQRRLGARPAPEVRLSGRGALLQADRRVRALLRRRPRPRRAVPPGHPAAAPDDHRAR